MTSLSQTVLHILLALTEGERHGYAIMKDVEAQSGGALRMGPGTLYTAVKKLLATGLIAEAEERPDPALDDQRRRYYRLTPHGWAAVRAEIDRLDRMVALARGRMTAPDPVR